MAISKLQSDTEDLESNQDLLLLVLPRYCCTYLTFTILRIYLSPSWTSFSRGFLFAV